MTDGVPAVPSAYDGMACFSVYAAGLAFNRAYKPLLDPLGLTYPQYLVMLALCREDGLAIGTLGERLFLESNTLTPLIKRLAAADLVIRQRDGADERVVRVTLTGKGRALGERAARLKPAIDAATGLATYDLTRLTQLLNRAAGNLRAAAHD